MCSVSLISFTFTSKGYKAIEARSYNKRAYNDRVEHREGKQEIDMFIEANIPSKLWVKYFE